MTFDKGSTERKAMGNHEILECRERKEQMRILER